MKKQIYLSFIFLMILQTVFSQHGKCGSDILLEEYKLNHPSEYQTTFEDEKKWNENINYEALRAEKRNPFVIPIVIHVIHDNGVGNITTEQIEDAIRVMNEDFNLQNSDLTNLRAPFDTQVADMQIEFKLAKIDPYGNCTNGIIRVNDPDNSYNVYSNRVENPKNASAPWNTQRYLNIWVVNTIYTDPGTNGYIAGYATFPNWNINNHGIVMRNDHMGTIGTSTNDGRTLTHEMGHALALYHTFQGGCSSNCNDGDQVCDTPPASESFFACDQNTNSCSSDPSSSVYGGDVVDMIENYMSYHNCQWMFSLGQKNRVTNAINAYLSTMVSSNNLIATGVNQPDALCSVQFSSNKTKSCIGEAINFFDESFSGVTSWSWDFGPNANPQTSTEKNPEVFFNSQGYHSVTLTVSNGTNSLTSTKNNYIFIKSTESINFSESFENLDLTNSSWETVDYNDIGFEINTNAFNSGLKSVYVKNRSLSPGDDVSLALPPLDLTNYTSGVQLKFNYAFAVKDGSNTDQLKIQLSRDCGSTWRTRKTLYSSELNTRLTSTFSDFTPSFDQWSSYTFDIPNSFHGQDLLIRFLLSNGGGNNLYLDDINVGTPLSTNKLEINSFGVKLYPNPTRNSTKLFIHSSSNDKLDLKVYNVSGTLVFKLLDKDITTGENIIELNKNTLGSGIYIVKGTLNNSIFVERLVIK